jgi:hypothetical protein
MTADALAPLIGHQYGLGIGLGLLIGLIAVLVAAWRT